MNSSTNGSASTNGHCASQQMFQNGTTSSPCYMFQQQLPVYAPSSQQNHPSAQPVFGSSHYVAQPPPPGNLPPMFSPFSFPPPAQGQQPLSPTSSQCELRQAKKAPYFNGQSSWSVYLLQFEMVAEINRWSENTKALELATSLRDGVSILGELSPEGLRNYDAIVSAITNQ